MIALIATFDYTIKEATEPGVPEIVTIESVRATDADGNLERDGDLVTIEGIATVDQGVLSSRTDFYIQDETAGINIFKFSDLGLDINAGDRVRVTGTLDQYNGLAELVPDSADDVTVVDSGNALPEPVEKSIAELEDFHVVEHLEGSLVKVEGELTTIGTNSTLIDEEGNNFTVRNGNGQVSFADYEAGDYISVTGIVSQYDSSSPYTDGYQIFPREQSDIADVVRVVVDHTPLLEVYRGNDITFTADVSDVLSVSLFIAPLNDSNYTEKTMTQNEEGTYEVTLPANEVPQEGFQYYIEAVNGDQTETSGDAANPHQVSVVEDTTGPIFENTVPAQSTQVEDRTPDISFSMFDESGIDLSTFVMTIDGTDVTSEASVNSGFVLYTPTTDLALVHHTVEVTAADSKGNSNSKSWTFEVVEAFQGGNHYKGTTHNHTEISHDGDGSPQEALDAAMSNNYDWFAFSDHSHDIDPELADQDTVDKNGMPERTGGEEWELTKRLADERTVNGEFVVFPAFEMTSTEWGHSNVFGTENFIDRKMDNGRYQDLLQYYGWVLKYDSAVAQFNHPSWPDGAFNNFMPYDKEVDQLFTMLEVGNGSGHYEYFNAEDIWLNALDLGWKIAPTYGEDNHDATWGETLKRTVIVSDNLTQDSLLNSMRHLRVYMTEDPNFTMDVKANGRYMGSTIDSQTLNFDISGQDNVNESESNDYAYLPGEYVSDDRIEKVELITNGTRVVDSISPMTKDFAWNPTVEVTGQQWFVVKVTQKDGEQMYSSPIWSKAVPYDLKINGIGLVGDAAIAGNPLTLEAGITNLGTGDVSNLDVTFYYDKEDEEHKIGTTAIDSLPSNVAETASVTWELPVAGNHNIIAVIENIEGDATTDNRFEKMLEVKEPLGITVMVDASHKNMNTSTDTGSYSDNLGAFMSLISGEAYTVVENTETLTDELLADVEILMLTHPGEDLTAAENTAVSNFVKNGGSLMVLDASNYNNDPTVNNDLLEEMGSTIQINNDGIFDVSADGNFWSNPNSMKHAVRLYPDLVDNYITDRVEFLDYYSGASLFKVGGEKLTNSDTVTVLAFGNETTYQNYGGNTGYFEYDTTEAGGSEIPSIAVETVGEGKVFVSGMNVFNDKQLDEGFEEKGNDEFAVNVVNWLANRGTALTDINVARDLSDGEEVVVEGVVTSDSNTFFDAFYVEDETGGIMAYKEVPADSLELGDRVRVYGHIKNFEGNLELEFDDFEKDVIELGEGEPKEPTVVTTGEASEDGYQGMLVKVTGSVVSKYDENSYIINDGSGDILVFTDGYIVNQSGPVPDLNPGDTLEAVGLAGTFSDGKRIRVRNTQELIGTKVDDEDQGETPSEDNEVTITDETIDEVSDGGVLDISLGADMGLPEIHVSLTASQIESLKERNISVSIDKGDVNLLIPSSAFNGDAEVTIIIEKLEDITTAYSSVYDFEIVQENLMNDFDEPLNVTFTIKSDKSTDEPLSVFYWNPTTEEWEEIGGTVENGAVSADLTHLSTYAVFESLQKDGDATDPETGDTSDEQGEDGDATDPETGDTSDEQGEDGDATDPETGDTSDEQGEDGDATDPETGDTSDGQGEDGDAADPSIGDPSDGNDNGELPDTATTMYNWIAVGLLLLIAGSGVLLVNRRRNA
ncbi:CehA/McbA family metallohydrolase [Bacillaceae bacterium S4-13-58]